MHDVTHMNYANIFNCDMHFFQCMDTRRWYYFQLIVLIINQLRDAMFITLFRISLGNNLRDILIMI